MFVLLLSYPILGHDLRIPFSSCQGGDDTFYATQIKMILDAGWIYDEPTLGSGTGLRLYDFPNFDAFHLLLCKLLGYVWPHWGAVLNLFFLLTFILTTITSLALLRYLQTPIPYAIVLSLLYAFQPYHLLREQQHLMPSAYYHLPLLLLVCCWLLERRGLAGVAGSTLWSKRFVAAVLIVFVSAFCGHYYIFFGLLFCGAAALLASVRDRRWQALIHVSLLGAVVFVGFCVNLLPNVLYWREHGPNRDISQKAKVGSEYFGLKMTQLLFPRPEHRITPLARLTRSYNTSAPLATENTTSALGVVAAVGFVVLLFAGLFRVAPRESEPEINLHSLGVLTLFGFLLATIGGGLAIFAWFVTPQWHAPNRISIFLALFALVAVGLLLRNWHLRLAPENRVRWAVGISAVLLVVGLLDQIAPRSRSLDHHHAETFARDQLFGQQLQAAIPSGAKVFLLPTSDFPLATQRWNEQEQLSVFQNYSQSRAYLHTSGVRWSEPCMTNRPTHLRQTHLGNLPPGELLEALALNDFAGVLIDTQGKRQREKDVLAHCRNVLGQESVSDGNFRFYFDLRDFARNLLGKYSPQELEHRRTLASVPVQVTLGLFPCPAEPLEHHLQRLSAYWLRHAKQEIFIHNHTSQPVNVRVRMAIQAVGKLTGPISIEGPLLNVEGSDEECIVEQTIRIAPGKHLHRIACPGKPHTRPSGLVVYAKLRFVEWELCPESVPAVPVAVNPPAEAP
jgi:phosphoglycerol transferase